MPRLGVAGLRALPDHRHGWQCRVPCLGNPAEPSGAWNFVSQERGPGPRGGVGRFRRAGALLKKKRKITCSGLRGRLRTRRISTDRPHSPRRDASEAGFADKNHPAGEASEIPSRAGMDFFHHPVIPPQHLRPTAVSCPRSATAQRRNPRFPPPFLPFSITPFFLHGRS